MCLYLGIQAATLHQLNEVSLNVTNTLPGNSNGWRMLETILDCASGSIEAVPGESCGQDFFIQCKADARQDAARIPVRCTSNMNFNPASETGFCDPFFQCGEETMAVCPPSGSLMVASTVCNEFFLCHNGTPEPKKCPDGTNFDPYYGTCTTSYDCNGFQCPEGAFTAGMGSCNRFFFCGADDPVSLECGPGWSYNPVQLEPYGGSCEENYQCQESSISENVQVLTPAQPCPERGTAFRMHEQDCSLYYYCRDGVERLQSCGLDQFDMFTGRCVQRNQATCFPGTS